MKRRVKTCCRLAQAGLLLAVAGCGNANLGAIDDGVDAREVMPGPGIFDESDGETPLKWSSDTKNPTAPAAQTESSAAREKAEFEEFKQWNRLRSEGAESAEYREFLQWLEYRKFKAAQ